MVTKMKHPLHGQHYATGHEIENLKANGWAICPPKVSADPAPIEAPAAIEVPEPVAQVESLPVLPPAVTQPDAPKAASTPKRKAKA